MPVLAPWSMWVIPVASMLKKADDPTHVRLPMLNVEGEVSSGFPSIRKMLMVPVGSPVRLVRLLPCWLLIWKYGVVPANVMPVNENVDNRQKLTNSPFTVIVAARVKLVMFRLLLNCTFVVLFVTQLEIFTLERLQLLARMFVQSVGDAAGNVMPVRFALD